MALDLLSISETPKILSYSTSLLTESGSDNGSVPDTITITLSGETFTATAVSGGHVTASNVPTGLTANFVRDSDTQITFSLSGNAVNHDNEDSISDLLIEFADAAFTGGDARHTL